MEEIYIAGIIGSLFTYVLTRGKEVGDKVLSRYNRHRNALIKLEQIYCENLDIIQRNIYDLEKLVSTILKASESGAIPMYFGKSVPIMYDRNVLMDLTTVDLMNEIMSMNIDCGRANSDIELIKDMYERMKPFLVDTKNANALSADINKEIIFLKDIDKQTEDLLAKVQILAQMQKPMLTRLIMVFMPKQSHGKKFEDLYRRKIREVREGRKRVGQESRERLNKLFEKGK